MSGRDYKFNRGDKVKAIGSRQRLGVGTVEDRSVNSYGTNYYVVRFNVSDYRRPLGVRFNVSDYRPLGTWVNNRSVKTHTTMLWEHELELSILDQLAEAGEE